MTLSDFYKSFGQKITGLCDFAKRILTEPYIDDLGYWYEIEKQRNQSKVDQQSRLL
jgi:hypothetical protein